MAWTTVDWACGHTGAMQLTGAHSGRSSRVAYEAGRKCFACWLLGQWIKSNDPRAARADRFGLATAIANGRGIRIYGEEVPSA